MAFRFPYTNFHEINLDWIVKNIKNLISRVTQLEESGGGGGGGTSNYPDLTNKPQINGVTLVGDKSTTQLGISIPDPANTTPVMDGTAAQGTSTRYARADHKHPSDTSRTTTGQVTSLINTALAGLTIPEPANTTPVMDGTAAQGTSTRYAREDHKHPSDTRKANKWNVTTIATGGDVTQSLIPDTFFVFTSSALTSLTLQIPEFSTSNQYHVRFNSGTTPPTLTITGAILPDGFAVEAGKIYELDILDRYVSINSWTGV